MFGVVIYSAVQCAHHLQKLNAVWGCTLDSGINVAPGRFGKNIKRSP